MANLLDEKTGPINTEGRDVNVIDKQLPVTVGVGSTIFEICIWVLPIVVTILIPLLTGGGWLYLAFGVVPGIIWLYKKQKAENYLQQLEQKIQTDASIIDVYIEQRIDTVQNILPLLKTAINLDKEVMMGVAGLRSGVQQGVDRNTLSSQVDTLVGRLFPQVENYPELKSHQTIVDAIQKDSSLVREIAAARIVYNNRVNQWNRDIFDWPTNQIVAAKHQYTTRIPFIASAEVKQRNKGVLFTGL